FHLADFLCSNLFLYVFYKFFQSFLAFISLETPSHRYFFFLFLFCTYYQHVRNLFHLSFPDLIADLLCSCINLSPDACLFQFFQDFLSIFQMFVGNGQHLHLYRSQPGWESSSEVLDQDTDKSLDRTEYHTVDHDRSVLLSVCSCILQFKPQRQLEVKLDGSALPGSSDGVFQMEINLWSVESSVSFVYNIGQPQIV